MVRLLFPICLLLSTFSFAQSVPAAADDKSASLQERYTSMKAKAETYQDYKVIKEYVLDGTWKIIMDSVKEKKLAIAQNQQTIAQLKADLQANQLTLSNERAAAATVVHDSTHISVLGIGFKKNVFLILVTVIFACLLLAGSAMAARMKLLQTTTNEKIVIADLVTKEFEDYKHKALDKQTKLARELQTEKNKLEELKVR